MIDTADRIDIVRGAGVLREIVEVEALTGQVLRLAFAGGEQWLYDASRLLDLPVLRPLRDPAYFPRVAIALGTVQWPDGQDLCADSLYEQSTPAHDPET